MKKLLMLIIVVSIPLFYFLQVWQVTRYNQLKSEVADLEQRQDDLIDQNSKILAGISFYRSPDRIEKFAVEELNLKPVAREQIMIINIKSRGEE